MNYTLEKATKYCVHQSEKNMAGLVEISMGKFMKLRWKSVQDLQILGRDFEKLGQNSKFWGRQ